LRPLLELPPAEGKRIEGLLFDLDDTFLTHGTLTRAAYDSLWSLRDAKLGLVVVTGRPASWGQVLALQWPVDAVVTENGAITCLREGRRVLRVDRASPEARAHRRSELASIVADVASRASDLKLTDDASGRVSDVTWDIGENENVAPERVAFAREIIAEHGARSSTSSVHLHATFDPDDKATGAVRELGRLFGIDATVARTRWAFAGDSGNDRACFAAFDTTFGVANVRSALVSIAVPPRYVSRASMGEGFVEIASALLKCKMT
jgi:HAD superfamily hydrolase (TIGR01484 family)